MGEKNIHAKGKYAYLNHLSTSELEKLLSSDLDSLENRDPERTLYILEVIEQRDTKNAAKRQTETDRAWKEFLEHYNTPEGEDCALYSSEVGNEEEGKVAQIVPRKKHRQLRRILLIAAVIACLITALIPTVLGDNGFVERIGQWTNEYFSFAQTESGGAVFNEELVELQTTIVDHGITESVVPKYLPEGYESILLEVAPMPDFGFTLFSAAFQKDDSVLSISIQKNNVLIDSVYEKDDNIPEVYERDGVTHYLFKNIDNVCVAWNNGKIECSIQGNVAIEELKKMVDSIYER